MVGSEERRREVLFSLKKVFLWSEEWRYQHHKDIFIELIRITSIRNQNDRLRLINHFRQDRVLGIEM